MKSIAPVLLMTACLGAEVHAQSPNVLPPLTQWTKSYDASKLVYSYSQGVYHFQRGSTPWDSRTHVSMHARFRVPVRGNYVLNTYAAAGQSGSDDYLRVTVAGLDARWRQLYDGFGARRVAMWNVSLEANKDYEIRIQTDTPFYYSAGDPKFSVGPTTLRKVELPVMLPEDNSSSFAIGEIAKMRIFSDSPATQSSYYLVYVASQRLATAIPLGFGALELAPPMQLLFNFGPTKSPGYALDGGRRSYELNQIIRAGLHWQVLEFDPNQIASTLRLGGAVQIRSPK